MSHPVILHAPANVTTDIFDACNTKAGLPAGFKIVLSYLSGLLQLRRRLSSRWSPYTFFGIISVARVPARNRDAAAIGAPADGIDNDVPAVMVILPTSRVS